MVDERALESLCRSLCSFVPVTFCAADRHPSRGFPISTTEQTARLPLSMVHPALRKWRGEYQDMVGKRFDALEGTSR